MSERTGRVLITGAGVAGPAAAYWLARTGHDVTVLERAPQLRATGQNIDVRGTAKQVLERMDLLEAVRAGNTGEVGTRFVDERGGTVSEFPVEPGEADGPTAELEILRGDLAALLADACPESVTWRFDDHVTGLEQDEDGVDVVLAGGGRERYDLVVVAEGPRSSTRGLVFADEDVALDRLGMYIAYGTIPRTAQDDRWWRWLNVPGARQISLRPDPHGTTRAMLAFRAEELGLERLDPARQRSALRARFGDVGWETPRILDGLDAAEDLYFEDLTQVRTTTWHSGRVVLTGDAAWCVTPIGGGGASLAVLAGYVLAAFLSTEDTPKAAFDAYEEWLRPVVEEVQDLPPGVPAVASPSSRLGVAVLRGAMRLAATAPVRAAAERFTGGPTTDRQLPPIDHLI